VPEALTQAVREEFYPSQDFHRVYFGEIVAAYADEDASARLGVEQTGAGKSLR
jgi:flavin reductase (DIM6/NTAB) family NADH-FMN oxidoreductase RutF